MLTLISYIPPGAAACYASETVRSVHVSLNNTLRRSNLLRQMNGDKMELVLEERE
jgi:hypothetical protein